MITVERPTILKSLLYSWLICFLGIEALSVAYKLFLPKKLPNIDFVGLWILLPSFCATGAALGVFIYVFLSTLKRKHDPYRFSQKQYRFAVVSTKQLENIKTIALKAGFAEITNESPDDWTLTRYTLPVTTITTQEVVFPTRWRVLNIAFSHSDGHLILEAFLDWRVVKRLFNFDADNDTYNLLEDLISKSGIQQFVTDESWQPQMRLPDQRKRS